MALLFQPEALVRARVAKGLSRAELAEASGLALRTIYNLETGTTTNPQIAGLRLLADALDVDVADLYESVEAA